MRTTIDHLRDYAIELLQSPSVHRRVHAFIAGFVMAALYALLSAWRS